MSRMWQCVELFSQDVCVDLASFSFSSSSSSSSTWTAGMAPGDLLVILEMPMITMRMATAATRKTKEVLKDGK